MVIHRSRKVVTLVACEATYLETDGSTSDRYVVLDLPELSHLGPEISAIRAITKTSNRTSAHQWRAVIEYSVDGRDWGPATPTPLFANLATNGQGPQTEITDADKFCAPLLRVSLATSNASGTGRESAYVWLILVVTLKT